MMFFGVFLSFSVSSDLQAQRCCAEFRSVCSGEVLDLNGSVDFKCHNDQGTSYHTTPINNGEVCYNYNSGTCDSRSTNLNSGNWEICDCQGVPLCPNGQGTFYVTQTLTNLLRINGKFITGGYNTSTSVACLGRVKEPQLNTLFSIHDMTICPGEPVNLKLQALNLIHKSGLCLVVELQTKGGSTIDEMVFSNEGSLPLNIGSNFDISPLFDGVDLGEVYRLQYSLTCCSRRATFNVNQINSRFWFYIQPEGQFAYLISAHRDGVIGQSSSTTINLNEENQSFPGTQLNTSGVDDWDFILYNIINPNSVPVQFSFVEFIDCNVNNEETIVTWLATPGNNSIYATGEAEIDGTDPCTCYGLRLRYDDGCGQGLTEDWYYFKAGPSCPNLQDDGSTQFRAEAEQDEVTTYCRVIPNPVVDLLALEMHKNLWGQALTLELYDTQGHRVYQDRIIGASQVTVDHRPTTGMYLFTLRDSEGKIYRGKFVKN